MAATLPTFRISTPAQPLGKILPKRSNKRRWPSEPGWLQLAPKANLFQSHAAVPRSTKQEPNYRLSDGLDGLSLRVGCEGGCARLTLPCLRSDPFGFQRAEAFGNSLGDSVSFRFPSRQNLEGPPASPAMFASSPAHPAEWWMWERLGAPLFRRKCTPSCMPRLGAVARNQKELSG